MKLSLPFWTEILAAADAMIHPRTKKFNSVPSAGNIFDTVFNITLVSFLPRRQHWTLYGIINKSTCMPSLSSFNKKNTRCDGPWQCQATYKWHPTETLTKFGWTVWPHPQYSPQIKPSHFNVSWVVRQCWIPRASGCWEGVTFFTRLVFRVGWNW